MRKIDAGQKLLHPEDVMEWFWTTSDSKVLPFSLEEEDEYARVEPCKNALVQLETGEYVGLQHAYERNAMALLVRKGESEAVIDHVLQELDLDVGRIIRATNPVWEARSLMRRAAMAAERDDGVTAMLFVNQALPILHRANDGQPNVDALLEGAKIMELVGAHERAEIMARTALNHRRTTTTR